MPESIASIPADDDIGVKIAEIEAKIELSSSRPLLVFVAAFGFIGLAVTLFGKPLLEGTPLKYAAAYVPLIGIGVTLYFVFAAGYAYILRTSRLSALRLELATLRAKQRINLTAPGVIDPQASPPSYFDRLVTINVTNLEAYYGLVKIHTNNSFLVAIAAGGVGFVLILTGLVVGFTSVQNAQQVAYISTGSGIVTEFIAGVFFYLYNRTVRQLKEYHDSLLAVQNILLSFKIVSDTTDDQRKNTMMEHMINRLVGSQSVAVEPKIELPTKEA